MFVKKKTTRLKLKNNQNYFLIFNLGTEMTIIIMF